MKKVLFSLSVAGLLLAGCSQQEHSDNDNKVEHHEKAQSKPNKKEYNSTEYTQKNSGYQYHESEQQDNQQTQDVTQSTQQATEDTNGNAGENIQNKNDSFVGASQGNTDTHVADNNKLDPVIDESNEKYDKSDIDTFENDNLTPDEMQEIYEQGVQQQRMIDNGIPTTKHDESQIEKVGGNEQ